MNQYLSRSRRLVVESIPRRVAAFRQAGGGVTRCNTKPMTSAMIKYICVYKRRMHQECSLQGVVKFMR